MTEETAFGLFITLGLLLALCVLLFAVFGPDFESEQEEEQQPSTAPKVETYGHPIDVVGEIRRGLPRLEHGHLWESWVDVNDEGQWVFSLNLLDVNRDNAPIGMWRMNLANGNLPYGALYKSWAETYASSSSKRKDWPREYLVAPAIGWAKQMHNRLYGSMRDYSTQL